MVLLFVYVYTYASLASMDQSSWVVLFADAAQSFFEVDDSMLASE